jgi:hypothetical protein
MIVKLRDQPFDLLVGPTVEQVGLGQLWERSLHCGSLFDSTLFYGTEVIRREDGKSLLEGVNVE